VRRTRSSAERWPPRAAPRTPRNAPARGPSRGPPMTSRGTKKDGRAWPCIGHAWRQFRAATGNRPVVETRHDERQ
jgi:hypothetical protein